jgi:protein DEK
LKKPPVKKGTVADGAPSDDDIKKLLKDILAEANLEEITMKTVCKKVYAYYPKHDLSQRKDFIKQTVKSVK